MKLDSDEDMNLFNDACNGDLELNVNIIKDKEELEFRISKCNELKITGLCSQILVLYAEPTSTWLTRKEKESLLKKLESDDKNRELDGESYHILRRLNNIPGLASVFSCVGHSKDNDEKVYAGYIILRTSEEVSKVLDKITIPKLWEEKLVTYVEKEWQYAFDIAKQVIPRVRFILRFPMGYMEKVIDSIVKNTREV
jgi:hypothetical protein